LSISYSPLGEGVRIGPALSISYSPRWERE
jgi:hypothetical protein